MTFEFVITGKTRSQIADVLRYIAFDIAHCGKVADVKQLRMSGDAVEIAYSETRPADAYTEAENASVFEAWSWFSHLKNAALRLEREMKTYDLAAMRARMVELGLSTFQVGAVAGVKQERVRDIIEARSRPTGNELFRICEALGIEEGDFSFEVAA